MERRVGDGIFIGGDVEDCWVYVGGWRLEVGYGYGILGGYIYMYILYIHIYIYKRKDEIEYVCVYVYTHGFYGQAKRTS